MRKYELKQLHCYSNISLPVLLEGNKAMKRTFVIIATFLLAVAFLTAAPIYRVKKVGKYPNFVALSPDGSKAYATSYETGELIEVDLVEKAPARVVYLGENPLGIAVTEDGKYAYVACKGSGTIVVVNLQDFSIDAQIRTGGAPNAVAFGPRGYRAFVTNYGRSRVGQLHIIDTRERKIEATINMGISPFGAVVSPLTEQIYVVNGGSDEVWVVDSNSLSVIKKIAVGEGPDGIAITPDGKRIFVTNSRSNELSVVDAQRDELMITIPVGRSPFGVAISADGKRVFVVNAESSTVSILPTDLSSVQSQSIAVDKGPTDIKVLPDNRTIVVVTELSSSLFITEVP